MKCTKKSEYGLFHRMFDIGVRTKGSTTFCAERLM